MGKCWLSEGTGQACEGHVQAGMSTATGDKRWADTEHGVVWAVVCLLNSCGLLIFV